MLSVPLLKLIVLSHVNELENDHDPVPVKATFPLKFIPAELIVLVEAVTKFVRPLCIESIVGDNVNDPEMFKSVEPLNLGEFITPVQFILLHDAA